MNSALARSYVAVTERPGQPASRIQLEMLEARYAWAAEQAGGKDPLEAGCGAGMGLPVLGRVARSVQAGDVDAENLGAAGAACTGHSNVELRAFHAEVLPFPDESFDMVLLFKAIYYLSGVRQFLEETRRVLRPRGTLLIVTVNPEWTGFHPSPLHTRYWSTGDLPAALREGGFTARVQGAFPETQSWTARAIGLIRRAAVVLDLIPDHAGQSAAQTDLLRTAEGGSALSGGFIELASQTREVRCGGIEPPSGAVRDRPKSYRMIASPARSIPFFDYPHLFLSEQQELTAIFRDVGLRGAFILQEDLARFERNLAVYAGVKYAIGVGNATDGLLFALRAAGIGPGDEVIFCSHTMVATPAAIHFTGATPVPVECGADHLIDPIAVERAVTPRTRAILPTQLNGRTADMQALEAIAERHGLVIVEDAAQALGSRFQGRAAGSLGIAGAVSFFPAKTLGCLGDGGAILTNSEQIYERVLQLRDHGRGSDGEIVSWGLNSRLDNLQAAILDFRLASYDATVQRRRALAGIYQRRLQPIRQLKLPPGPDHREHVPEHFDVFQNYEIEAERRDELRAFLKSRQIGSALPWGGKAVHQWPRLGFKTRLPFTERLFERVLLLPLNLSLTDHDVHTICNTIEDFYQPS